MRTADQSAGRPASDLSPAKGDTFQCDGLLLIGHGTRDPAGLAEFQQLVGLVRRQNAGLPVQDCFLELAEPTIAEGLARLAERGARRVRAVPLVLFAAGHSEVDIPQALAKAASQLPALACELAQPLGCHPRVLELSARRFKEALGEPTVGASAVEAQDTLLVLVGRGSSYPAAAEQFRRFAELRGALTPVGQVEIGFVAMAEPKIDAVLERAARLPFRRIVVQPHLLFYGLVLTAVRASLARWAQAAPEKQWISAMHLGPDAAIAAVVRDAVTCESGN